MSFESFSFDRRIVAGIDACGFTAPTPIQAETIPAILRGEDVLGLAQTGTGKTAAFALPILQHLINVDANRRGPIKALVLAPTRELALQIQETFIDLGKQTGHRCACVFGGVGIVPQIKAMRSSSIAVACPGRLLDIASRKECDLSQVEVLVLDEADRMFDMGFLPDLRRILALLPAQRQNLLFSATMPKEIRFLADSVLKNPVTVQVNHTQPKASISHEAYTVPTRHKTSLLEALLKETEHENVLVFTRTKHRAKNVARVLGEKGWKATSLQGNLSQNRRQEALEGFRAGRYKIMVATDIAARGIDCSSISHVINYDVPDTAETYTHRIGRTGRAERTGTAITIIAGEDASLMRTIERNLGSTVKRVKLEGFECAAADEQDQDFGRPARSQFGKRGGNGYARRNDGPRGKQSFSRDDRKQPFSREERQKPGFGDDVLYLNNKPLKDDSREQRADNKGNGRVRQEQPRDGQRPRRNDNDRDFSRSMDRQRGGMRSPYSDQLGAAPKYARAAKPAFGDGGAKPWRRDGDESRTGYNERGGYAGRDARGVSAERAGRGDRREERSDRGFRADNRDDRGYRGNNRDDRDFGNRRNGEKPFGKPGYSKPGVDRDNTRRDNDGRSNDRFARRSDDGRGRDERSGKPFDRSGDRPYQRREHSFGDKADSRRGRGEFAKADNGNSAFPKRSAGRDGEGQRGERRGENRFGTRSTNHSGNRSDRRGGQGGHSGNGGRNHNR